MSAIFGDHMVLQQGTSLPIWGEADPGEQVTVRFVGQEVITTARQDRQWRVNLKPVYLRSSPDILTVDGKNHLEFSDVLVGDVWLCSGQSNMALPLREAAGGEAAIVHAEEEQLRLFTVFKKRALQPQRTLEGRWERCSPEAAANFSAVAYFFGRDIRMATGMPLGLIGSYYEGSSAQAWMSLAALQQSPSFSEYVAEYYSIVRHFFKNQKTYDEQKNKYEQEMVVWEKEVNAPYQAELVNWRLKCKEACERVLAQPIKPEPLSPQPLPPASPDGGPTAPTVLFNAMIAPLIPYAITGVIWYQGESNENRGTSSSWMSLFPARQFHKKSLSAFEYRRLFQRLIRSWRSAWGEGPFPFYFVSLASFRKSAVDPVEALIDDEGNFLPGWAWLREGQIAALSLPETGLVVTTDIGSSSDIHPKDKLDVGRRLALLARRNLYAQKVMAYGPTYDSMKKEEGKLRVHFAYADHGLIVAAPPWQEEGQVMMVPRSLQGFAITEDHKQWYDAKAVIEGNEVVLSSEFVAHPTAVRYNWKDHPTGNLYNKEGLPAPPFRTDFDQPR